MSRFYSVSGVGGAWRNGRLAWLPLALLGCREPTQATVEIYSDLECKDMVGTQIALGSLGQIERRAPSARTEICSPLDADAHGRTSRIGSLVLLPSDAKDESIAFEVVSSIKLNGKALSLDDCAGGTAQLGGVESLPDHCIAARRALRFIPHEPLTIPLTMTANCAGIPCGALSTCVDGACVSVANCQNENGICTAGTGGAGAGGAGSSPGGAGGVPSVIPTKLSACSKTVQLEAATASQRPAVAFDGTNVVVAFKRQVGGKGVYTVEQLSPAGVGNAPLIDLTPLNASPGDIGPLSVSTAGISVFVPNALQLVKPDGTVKAVASAIYTVPSTGSWLDGGSLAYYATIQGGARVIFRSDLATNTLSSVYLGALGNGVTAGTALFDGTLVSVVNDVDAPPTPSRIQFASLRGDTVEAQNFISDGTRVASRSRQALGAGGLRMVVWNEVTAAGPQAIMFRLVSASAVPVGPTTELIGSGLEPEVAFDGMQFTLLWHDASGVYTQAIAVDGKPVGTPKRILATWPSAGVSMTAGGGKQFVTWLDDASGSPQLALCP